MKRCANDSAADPKEDNSADNAPHPGQVLLAELDSRQIKKSHFAALLGIKPGHLSELLYGKRNVSAAMALKLERFLDMPAEYWVGLQGNYDLFLARKKIR